MSRILSTSPSSARCVRLSTALQLVSAMVLCLLCAGAAQAQSTVTTTDKMTPSGMAPGAPAGSYALSGFENINLFNGNLDFRLPLITLGGRGSAQHSIMLSINTKKWRVRESHTETTSTYTPTTANWGSVNVGYSAGKLQGRQSGYDLRTCINPSQKRFRYTLTRLTFVTPDGTEYDLRDELTDGRPMEVTNWCSSTTVGASRGTVFKTRDGSGVTFISDGNINDKTSIPTTSAGSWNLIVSGYLVLRDGTRYRIDSGGVTWIRDRNGNLIYSQQDAIGRTVSITTSTDGTEDQLTYKGFGGAARTIRVVRSSLGNALRSGYVLRSHAQLFPELNGSISYGSGAFNPSVVSSVILPDGRSYRFYYNSYGELARVELPTGGAIEYDMNAGSGVLSGIGLYGDEKQIYRRVVERRTYADGSTLEGRTTYTESGQLRTVDHLTPGGALLARERHYFNGDAAQTLFAPAMGTFYSDWREGKETATEYLAADGATVLQRVSNTWEQRAPVSWYPSLYANGNNEPANDPRITQTVTTLVDTNQVSKKTFLYDQYNNQTDIYEYDYGAGAAGPLVRRTHTDYLTTNPINGLDYTTNSVHLKSLPAQTSVYDANGVEQSRTTFEYDNYSADGTHAALVSRPGTINLDAAYTSAYQTRGNNTRLSRWILATNTPLSSYQQYDVVGNVVKMIDARGNATTLDYSDRFGAPDGNARTNTQPAELGAQASYAFATSATNALGHTVYGQYDYYLGVAVDGEDANGIVASGFYNDLLDRPTQVIRAYGTVSQSQSTFSYNDAARLITSTSDLNSYSDNLLKSEMVYDGLGRTIETRQYESFGVYIATRQSFDALGRASQSSNPFRPTQGETPVWTTMQYDGLGRVTSIIAPDSATTTTSYSGNQTTATDPAGKSRRSTMDALGRLSQVVEDPSGLAYATDYLYDVLGNLRRVQQGVQTRFFMYDSLGRLIRVKNPEQTANANLSVSDPLTGNSQWSAAYDYDANGNLSSRTDARGLTATYSYDALNRSTVTNYSDGTSTDRHYDGGSNGRGRFWYGYAYSQNNTRIEYTDAIAYDALGHSLTERRQFNDNGTWGPVYTVQRTLDLAGNVTSQTYPSGRTVAYSYDTAGRQSSFSGNLGDSVQRTYSSAITYNQLGGIEQEQFGTQTPLFHKLHYNVRGQLYDIRLSTVAWSADQWNWNRGALVLYYGYGWQQSGPANNGNLSMAQHWVPTDDQVSSYNYTEDRYSYDSLNRLASVTEYPGSPGGLGAASFTQAYDYDRYGNRTINAAQTWGVAEPQFNVNASNNQLSVPAGSPGTMSYDAAGNLTTDTYTGQGTRTYDAENRLITAQDAYGQVSRYTYDLEGRRVRRNTAGQEVWQIYGIGGELLAEYAANAAASSPQKEYGYRNGELLITAASGADLQWVISDHLGTPRMLADKTGALSGVKRHDYLPFGEELSAGTGARTTQQGYTSDNLRQKFTGYERDVETGLDFAQARYYSSSQGRFTSIDPLLASGRAAEPQSWNRYAYVVNKPLNMVDPRGMDGNAANEQRRQQMSGQQPQPPQPPPPPKQVVDIRDSKVINKRLDEINKNAKPLAEGVTPVATSVEHIVGEEIQLHNATVTGPDGLQVEVADGYMRPVAVVVLDQGGNIMKDPNMTATENVKPANDDARTLVAEGRQETTNNQAISQQPNGAFYDAQLRAQGAKSYDIQTTQDITIKSGRKGLFKIEGVQIRMNDATKSITMTPGKTRKFY